jgi:hypothetical protein
MLQNGRMVVRLASQHEKFFVDETIFKIPVRAGGSGSLLKHQQPVFA